MQYKLEIMFLLIVANVAMASKTIAVLDLEAKGVSEMQASVLSDRLRSELFDTDTFRVVEREMMQEIFREQNFQMSGCVSTECIVEAGKIMGVEQIIGGSVSKFGSILTVSVRIVDVETGEIVNSAVIDHTGNIEEILVKGMKKIAQKLADTEAEHIEQLASQTTTKDSVNFLYKVPPLPREQGYNESMESDSIISFANNYFGNKFSRADSILTFSEVKSSIKHFPQAKIHFTNYRNYQIGVVAGLLFQSAGIIIASNPNNSKSQRNVAIGTTILLTFSDAYFVKQSNQSLKSAVLEYNSQFK